MKIEVSSEKENPFMKRKEVLLDVEHPSEPAPTKAALQALSSRQFGYDIKRTDVRHVITETGMSRSKAKIFVWQDKEVADLSKPAEEKKEAKEESKQEAPKEAPAENKEDEKKAAAEPEENKQEEKSAGTPDKNDEGNKGE